MLTTVLVLIFGGGTVVILRKLSEHESTMRAALEAQREANAREARRDAAERWKAWQEARAERGSPFLPGCGPADTGQHHHHGHCGGNASMPGGNASMPGGC